jgi:dipeptidyl aminopeptidase/acylaminoacyl peptidase
MGVVHEPKLYRCAIGFGGYYDLKRLIEDRDFGFEDREYFQRALGRDLETLHVRSPVHNAASIEVPVLLVHGEKDFSARFEHAARMHSELQRLGKPVELLAVKDESHEIYDPQTRRDVYQRILDFLKTHLQARAEP